ncbi:MAG: hypothetical protein ACLRVT_04825 [Oscillospiraceae bacterium]
MKILEINAVEFSKYGAFMQQPAVKPRQSGYETRRMNPTSGRSNELCRFGQEVLLEPLDGVGVLFVSENKHGFKMFLLTNR